MTPLDIDEYIDKGGFSALMDCLNNRHQEDVINIIKDSGLRGRGGAGFPTGVKWEAVRRNVLNYEDNHGISSKETSCQFTRHCEERSDEAIHKSFGLLRCARNDDDDNSSKRIFRFDNVNHPTKTYLICNGDEGDPGAFMDRMMLESFPYRIIEGMLIAAYTVGASEGIFYIRAEYPVAIATVKKAIDECEKKNIIGENIFNSNFSIKLSIVEGAGAFVCGEETALIKSIEGKRGMPTPKPPFPAESG
jgi:NADH:ubiquinone oxidoreductase subunit F (NADH-binding)